MASEADMGSSWADDEAYEPGRTSAQRATEEHAMTDTADGNSNASLPHAENDDGMQEDTREHGKRVTDVDAETDRMARLFLGKEDEEHKKMRLKIVQADPNSHLGSAKTFEEMGLPPYLLRGVQHMGFEKPSAIQEAALPICLRHPPENLLAQAQSGSGKTAAFCLAGLYRVDPMTAMPQLLIVTPTRELAVQCVQETIMPMGQYMTPPLRAFLCLKGVRPPSDGIREQVVVGTPGSIIGALKRRTLLLTYVKVFVLDEADAMLEESAGSGTSHRDHCMTIKRYLPDHHQTLLFSATFPRHVRQFGRTIASGRLSEIMLPSEQDLVLDVITQLWIDMRNARQTRLELLQELYDVLEMGQSIIFCRTKFEADAITNNLQRQGFRCSNLHGNLEGEDRDRCMDGFRQGENKVLITTNVLARGVDIPAVSLVINYDMPTIGRNNIADPDTYLHRIGRTGRFGRRGVAINLVESDQSFDVLRRIEDQLSPGRPMIRPASTDVEELEKIIVEESKKRVAVLDNLQQS